MKLVTCEFNMDSGCVELRFDDGMALAIYYTAVGRTRLADVSCSTGGSMFNLF